MVYSITLSTRFANVYGGGGYDRGIYNNSAVTGPTPTSPTPSATVTTATTSTSTPSAGGTALTNTGFDVLLVVSLACLMIFAALIVRFWKQKNLAPKP